MKKENIQIKQKVQVKTSNMDETIEATVTELKDTTLIVKPVNNPNNPMEIEYDKVSPYIPTKEEFTDIINENLDNVPSSWRYGQKIFNIVDSLFGVARTVQFQHGVDCFYVDKNVSDFIDKSYEVYTNYLIEHLNDF